MPASSCGWLKISDPRYMSCNLVKTGRWRSPEMILPRLLCDNSNIFRLSPELGCNETETIIPSFLNWLTYIYSNYIENSLLDLVGLGPNKSTDTLIILYTLAFKKFTNHNLLPIAFPMLNWKYLILIMSTLKGPEIFGLHQFFLSSIVHCVESKKL